MFFAGDSRDKYSGIEDALVMHEIYQERSLVNSGLTNLT